MWKVLQKCIESTKNFLLLPKLSKEALYSESNTSETTLKSEWLNVLERWVRKITLQPYGPFLYPFQLLNNDTETYLFNSL